MAQQVERIGRSITPRHLAEWLRSPILWGGFILLTVVGLATGYGIVQWVAGPAPKDLVIVQQSSSVSVTQPVQQVSQNVQENVAPAGPVIVDYHGVWTEVKGGFDPSTIPVEDGFYGGAQPYNTSSGINPNDPTDIPERTAYAWKILPQLEGKRAVWNKSIRVAAARDESNKDIVLLALDADRHGPYILLSVDGERSFCKLDLLPVDSNGDDAVATRVVARGEEIHLYGQDPRPGSHWWEQVAKKSELPCS